MKKFDSTPFYWKILVIGLNEEILMTKVFKQLGQDDSIIEYWINAFENIFLGRAAIECYTIDEKEYLRGKEGGDVRDCPLDTCFYPFKRNIYKKEFSY